MLQNISQEIKTQTNQTFLLLLLLVILQDNPQTVPMQQK